MVGEPLDAQDEAKILRLKVAQGQPPVNRFR